MESNTNKVVNIMKIFYLLHWNDGMESGVIKKLKYQVDFWEKNGCEVCVGILTERNSTLHREVFETNHHFFSYCHIFDYKNVLDRLKKTKSLELLITQINPDLIYLRKLKYDPNISKALKSFPSVMELNGMPRPLSFDLGCIYDALTFGLLFRRIDGIVAVANEICNDSYYNKKKLKCVIGNSIRLDSFDVLPAPKKTSKPTLVYMGTPYQYWQGVDKILDFANKKPDWRFHIIGSEKSEFENTRIKYSNVTFHGLTSKNRYKNIFRESHVALGSLARHRRGMNETSTLKVREYLAFGLPVIMAHEDPDFTGKEEFIQILPNRENCLKDNMKVIEDFVARWIGDRVERAFVSHLDVSVKESERLRFFSAVIKGGAEC